MPARLERDALAQSLREIIGSATAVDAVRAVAERALANYPPVYAAIVRDMDFGGMRIDAFLAQPEYRDAFSMRTLYRHRVEATAAIRAEVERLMQGAAHAEAADADVALGVRPWLRPHGAQAALEEACACFEQAVELDPESADARRGLATTYRLLGQQLLEKVVGSRKEAVSGATAAGA